MSLGHNCRLLVDLACIHDHMYVYFISVKSIVESTTGLVSIVSFYIICFIMCFVYIFFCLRPGHRKENNVKLLLCADFNRKALKIMSTFFFIFSSIGGKYSVCSRLIYGKDRRYSLPIQSGFRPFRP